LKEEKDLMTNNDVHNTTQKTKDRATPTHGISGRVSSSCCTCDTRRVTLVTNPVIGHEQGKDRIAITINGTFPWSFVTKIVNNGLTSHVQLS